MQQYLINTTAIWLLSLLLFDVFLRRESYHSYNRFYLLSTLLLGAILPLVQWANPVQMYTGVVRSSVERVAIVKQNIAVASSPAGTSVDWARWLLLAYVVGAVIALCLLAIEIIKLWRLSFAGKRSLQDGWQIIETGRQHAAFSFLNRLYVSGKEQYDAEEWRMILVHEGRHTSLRHIVDLTILHLARIIFWFHPLVYIYNRRLLLVHEYQADNTAAQQPQHYGRFLIEQAVLHAAPSITHSFNRSPIKKRILMLNHRSSSVSRIKMFVALPLITISVLYFSYIGYSQSKRASGTITFANMNGPRYRTTYSAILADPIARTTKPGCSIESCTMSFLPKGEFVLGPYKCPAGKMKQELVDYLKKYKGENIKVFIEDIMLSCNSKIDSSEMPIVLIATEKM